MTSTDSWSEGKVFCIGCNKTGTTSLEQALDDLGYRVGSQPRGEGLLPQYLARNFRPILEFCKSAEAFQDVPFSLPYTYVLLDHYFPKAKFILSVRDSAEQWYESCVRADSAMFGGGALPTADILKTATYSYPGFMWDAQRVVVPDAVIESEPYHKPSLLNFYETHNDSVRDYFKWRGNMIEINLDRPGDYRRLCKFLEREPIGDGFPRLNRSSEKEPWPTTN
jgi:hypothetical protein